MPIYSKPYKTATYVSDDDSRLLVDMFIAESFPGGLSVHTPTHQNNPIGAPHALNP
jgi:hypothetical protein